MEVTIEIDNKSKLEKLSALFKTFKINMVKIELPTSEINSHSNSLFAKVFP
jgi:hypothetical protein